MSPFVRRTRVVALLLGLILGGLLSASGCGGATGALLTIESDLQVPRDVDELLVRIESDRHPAKEERKALETPFPHTLAIVLEAPMQEVTVTVRALKNSAVVTSAQVKVDVVGGVLREYTLSL
ncbi:MAG: hypothetical protein D6729_09755 [Deltaproteobacteria bacterium]|nr:MAG: hypothetical protein D6729_09755 [Deltaproteobacteria bacterium]